MSPRKQLPLPTPLKELPANLDAEKCVLGAAVDSPEILSAILAEGLSEEDFSVTEHQQLWRTILEMASSGIPVDLVSLLDHRPELSPAMIVDLTYGVVLQDAHIVHYCRILKRKSALRALLRLSEWISNSSADVAADPATIQRKALATLTEMSA